MEKIFVMFALPAVLMMPSISSAYTCWVDADATDGDSPPSVCQSECSGPISVVSSFGIEHVVDVNTLGSTTLDVYPKVVDPTGWSLHVSDSPTNDGYGGDGGTTNHDAEVYIINSDIQLFGNDIGLFTGPSGPGVSAQAYNLISSGSDTLHWTIEDDSVTIGRYPNIKNFNIQSKYALQIGYSEPDAEDPDGTDEFLWYVGLNRTVGSPLRNGTGVKWVCFVLN